MSLINKLFGKNENKRRAEELRQFHIEHYPKLLAKIATRPTMDASQPPPGKATPQGTDAIIDHTVKKGSIGIARSEILKELNVLIKNMNETIRLDPNERSQYLDMAWLLGHTIVLLLEQHMDELGKNQIKLIELPIDAREEIKRLKREGRERFELYTKRKGVITSKEQTLEILLK
jgi:hypothetical protein